MASFSNLLLAKVLIFVEANGQQTTVSVEPWVSKDLTTISSGMWPLTSSSCVPKVTNFCLWVLQEKLTFYITLIIECWPKPQTSRLGAFGFPVIFLRAVLGDLMKKDNFILTSMLLLE